jgi:hypothetical protein
MALSTTLLRETGRCSLVKVTGDSSYPTGGYPQAGTQILVPVAHRGFTDHEVIYDVATDKLKVLVASTNTEVSGGTNLTTLTFLALAFY